MLSKINNGAFVFLISIIYSLIEIEMEGKNGWAKNLPTARNVIFTFTLYHLYMMAFVFLIFYQLFIDKDIWMMTFYTTMFFYIEDFLWFVLNPYFTIKKYNSKNVKWHKKWILGQPIENYISYLIFMFTYYNTNYKSEHTNSLIVIILLLSITVLLSPIYHKFYLKIHGKKITEQT